MAGRGSRRTTFDKLQRERARREKQAAKRARRQGGAPPDDRDGPPQPQAITPLGPPEEQRTPEVR
jgi:hypothetical protein